MQPEGCLGKLEKFLRQQENSPIIPMDRQIPEPEISKKEVSLM